MGMWSIRASCLFLFFSLIVSDRLGSCASINEEGRDRSRFIKGVEDDGQVLILKIQGATQRRFLQARDQHDRPSSIHKSEENQQYVPSSKPSDHESETSKSSTLHLNGVRGAPNASCVLGSLSA